MFFIIIMQLLNRTFKKVFRVYGWASSVQLQNRHGVTNQVGDQLVTPLQLSAQEQIIAAIGNYDRCKRGSRNLQKSNLLDKRKRKYGPLLQWETELNTSPHWSVSTHAYVH